MRIIERHAITACALLTLLVATGCDSCQAKSPSSNAKPSPVGAQPAVSAFGVIEGTVRLAEAQELPEVPPKMMFQQILQQTEPLPLPAECTPAKQADRRPVQLGPGNTLSSIFLAASDYKSPVSRAPKVHDVTIRDCRLTPMVIGAMRGDTLRITSQTDYAFMPQFGAANFSETIVKGQERTHALEALGVSSVLCGFTAQCGRTDVVTVAHPLYALSGANGRFRIEGVPANETFNLNAWHPLFKATTQSVSVGPGETKQVDFVMTPDHQYTPTGQEEQRRREAEARKPVAPGTRPD